MKHLSIGINGLFLSKPHTGTGKYLTHTLHHLVFSYPHTHFYIYYPAQIAQHISNFPFLQASNVTIIHVDVPLYSRDDQIWKYVWERIFLPRSIEASSVDIFWTPYHSTTKLKSIPHIMTVLDIVHHADPRYVFNRRRALYMKQADKAASQANHILTISYYSKNEISKYLNLPKNQITVAHLGAPDFPFPQQEPPLSNPFIVYVGGFDVRKNVPRLLESFALFIQKHPDTPYRLVMPGSIPNSPLISNIYEDLRRLQLEPYVVLPGAVSEDILHSYLYHAETLVYPSVYEGFGLPILEGMQARTPVITANFGSMKEVSGEAAHCVDTTSVEDLFYALETVLHNAQYQENLKEKGAQRVTEFTWDQTAHIIGKTLHSLYI